MRGAATDDGGRLAPRVLGGCRPRGAHFVGFLAGADGPWPCALRLCGLGHVRGRCAGPPRWGGSRMLADLWGYCGYTTLIRGVWTLPLEVPIRRRRL